MQEQRNTTSGANVEYVPCDPPIDLGWQNSSSGWFQTYIFGRYHIRIEDGWTYVVPHSGSPGTVGAEPVDLELNPEFREHLIELAIQARNDATPAEREGPVTDSPERPH